MKLIIRDEKEDTCEIWLEYKGEYIHVMSKRGDGTSRTEVVIYTNMEARHVTGNFKWDAE